MNTSTIDIAGLEGGRVSLTSEQLEDLDSRIEGPLLRAGDEGWDEAVLVWNGMVGQGARARRSADVGPRRRRGRWVRAGARPAAQHQGRRPQHRRDRDRRGRPDAGHVAHARRHGRSCRQARARRAGVSAAGRRPGDAGARARDGARVHLRGRRRRPDPRRRPRLSGAPLRLDGGQPRGGRDRHRGRPTSAPPTATRTPTCSGRSGAAAATSASSPASPSACTRLGRRSTAA